MMSASWPDADDPNAQLLASVLPPRPTSLGARVREGLEDLWSSRGAPAYAWLSSQQPWLRWAFVGVATLGPVLGLAQRVASNPAAHTTHALAQARVGSSVPIAAASMLPSTAAAPRAALTEARAASTVEASAGNVAAPTAAAPVVAPSVDEPSAPALDSSERTADKPKKKSKSRASHRATKASTRHHRAKAASSSASRS